MTLHESAEMYLETIYLLQKHRGSVRSIDVAEEMGYSKPSISRGVSLLKQGGFLEVDSRGLLILTPKGKQAAEKVYERHQVLTRLLTKMGVPEKAAAEDACKIEHVICDETFDAIKTYLAQEGQG